MSAPSVLFPVCANWTPTSAPCKKLGNKACTSCKLVVYCSVNCQKAHWADHKKHCKSPMIKDKWRPAYYLEGRTPAWEIGAAASNLHNPFGGEKYLWGNTPALDVLKLEQNEGLGYADDIALLFAASGDLRHVVKTIANIPDAMTQQFRVTMNDREFEVVARNAILLLLALTSQDSTNHSEAGEANTPSDIAEALIHVWYSASIPSSVLSLLQSRVKPLIVELCSRIADRPENAVLAKTWKFSTGQTLRLVLKKTDWLRLQEFCDVPDGMTPEDATRIRTAVTLAPERADYRDRWYYKDACPSMRIAKQRFREDGLLLPFGHPRTAFNVPNPTLFSNSKSWLMSDKADPSAGWPTFDVKQTSSPAAEDWYGKLFVFLHKVLKNFLGHLKETRVSFDIYNVDAKDLPLNLKQGIYSRIEVANICDFGYLGIRNTLDPLLPLLQLPRENPHATFITTFINAVKEVVKMGNSNDGLGDLGRITNYLPFQLLPPLLRSSPDILRVWDAHDLVADVDKYFERYMAFFRFKQISADFNVEMKAVHTIVEKWPTRLKLQLGEKGDKEEFLTLLGSSFTGTERYVEWRRVG
ncbi:hypothetical protein VE03_03695 [Pseudogymnoascus sp. 23342-1-I1]|nr:hypothetical protein VE03_03695 [Pseudogymnoascus sp. 23342-1-I1]